jgi:hypothetical protein
MNRRTPAAAACAMLLVLLARAVPGAGGRGPEEGPAPTRKPAPGKTEDEIARHITATRPGPEHQWLDPLVGSWKTDVTWYAPPSPPAHLKGTTENRWILGGRFLLSEGAVGEGASIVEGMTIYGYDTRERRFSAVGLNNLNVRTSQLSGIYDPVERSFLLTGKVNQEAGGFVVYRHVLKIYGPDRYTLSVFFELPGRSPQKLFESSSARR